MEARAGLRSSVSLLLIRQIFVQGISFLATIFVIKSVSRIDYGIYSLFNVIFIYFTNLFGVWITSSLIIRKELKSEDLESLRFIFFVTSISGIFLSSFAISLFFNKYYNILVLINCIFIYALCISNASLVQIEKDRQIDMSLLVKSEVYQSICFYGFLTLGAISNNFVLFLALAYISRGCVVLAVYKISLRMIIPITTNFSKAFSVIIDSAKLQSFTILNLSKDLFIPLIIGGSLGLGVLAIINWATFVASYPVLLFSSISRVLLPYFIKSTEKNIGHEFLMASFIAGGISTLISLPIFFFRSDINLLLFSGAWNDGLILFAPFMIVSYVIIVSSVAMSKLQSMKKGLILIISGLLIFIMTITSCLIVKVFKEYYIWGYLNLLTSLSYITLIYWCCRELNIRISQYFLRISLMPILVYVFSIVFIDKLDIYKQALFIFLVMGILYINMRFINYANT